MGCSKQEVLLKEITEDGGIYYFQNEPFIGIEFLKSIKNKLIFIVCCITNN